MAQSHLSSEHASNNVDAATGRDQPRPPQTPEASAYHHAPRSSKEISMIGKRTRNALLVGGCLLLAGCGATQRSTAGGAHPTSTAGNPSPTAIATVSGATATAAAGGGLTACGLITEQDATTAIGSAAGPGTAGGGAALSECIYGDGALIVGMKTDSKAFYDTSHAAAQAKGATNVTGVGDSAFQAGAKGVSTLEFLKGTTLVSIILSGPDAQNAAVAVAKVAASRI
jgi:hypothetical protein